MLLEKAYRIKKNADFQRIYKKGHSVANRQFVVYTCNNKEIDHFRLGISVSKKLGNAVLRNKIKRAIRENFKVHKSHILAKDIIVIARQPAKDMTTLQIQNSLEHVLKIAKVFNKKLSKDRVGEVKH
ncbi:TPA: ribonuclease P protein component [Staphylococcus aureus]|uniref:ribonuclease P protein component n=3 Tax=Staphylococcus aureus TaxID=1280 RepID=UPI00044A79DE|nr:ribonuclease P protein component [Staphylococcus aureus]AYV00778.1 Ribonuclease P protein component [Staphylococcus aureus]EZI03444.1 ribonuclease P protein component [Staphylococcus aureus subsp. aureus 21311]MDZ5819319.1 ribonuclease P protein component [Staphylococcus aureus]MDZ7533188.1 ribonuclease P protein component [Staphylococcus aureus]ULV81655.1 ribonuclease P protein component [Staphylococcus aureus]